MTNKKALVCMFATALLWSMGGVLIKRIHWNPLAIAGMRSLLAVPVLLPFLRKEHFRWNYAQLGAALCYTATLILYVVSTKLTSAANAILLQYTAPVYVVLFGAFILGEKADKFDWLTIGLAFLGISLFFCNKLTARNLWGNILAIINGITFAFMIIFMRKQKQGYPLVSAFLGNILTAIVCLPFMLGSMPARAEWGYLGILGIFQVGVSYVFYTSAIKRLTALEGTLIPIIEPVLNPVWVFIFVGENPGFWSIIGGIIVILALVLRAAISISADKDCTDRQRSR